jgi:hypothetical protein
MTPFFLFMILLALIAGFASLANQLAAQSPEAISQRQADERQAQWQRDAPFRESQRLRELEGRFRRFIKTWHAAKEWYLAEGFSRTVAAYQKTEGRWLREHPGPIGVDADDWYDFELIRHLPELADGKAIEAAQDLGRRKHQEWRDAAEARFAAMTPHPSRILRITYQPRTTP